MRLGDLNAMSREAAERELGRCCASTRWAAALAARRPFGNVEELSRAADEIWWTLEGGDWLEAFSRHPRIGDRVSAREGEEQAGVRGATPATMARLAELNHDYERKFGHVFLICATGKRADEMLANLERRLSNDPAAELRIAAVEQAKITRLRLEKMLGEPLESSRRGRGEGT